MGAQFMNGPSSERDWISYNDPNIYHLNFPYPWQIDDPEEFFEKEILTLINKNNLNPSQDICGFMLETYQGWGAIFIQKNSLKRFITSLRNIIY